MNILGYNISIGRVEAGQKTVKASSVLTHEDVKNKSKKKAKRIASEIRKQSLARIAMNMQRWKTARTIAESEINPNNTELIRVFRDIVIDAHLWALMQTVRLKVMANKFNIYNSAGEIDEEATDKFNRKWFRIITKETVDSEFYGFSLVQLGDIVNGCFVDSKLVPREYVIQQRSGVKKSLGNSKDLIPFDSGVYANWLVPIGEKDNLGLLDKAAPLVIKKKEVLVSWSEAAELFGMPMRIGTTAIQDTERRENMEEMLENMGEAAWAVIDEEDSIELKETSKTDFSDMYDKFIERVNSELSKLVLLQTGTTDEKTHVGSANVMENILKDLIEAYIIKVEDITNEVVIPLCIRHSILPLGSYIKADDEQKIALKDHFDIVKELLPQMKLSKDWIAETFNVVLDESDNEENVDEKSQAELRGSVGGVQALIEVIRAVSDGVLEVDAAVNIVVTIYGIDEQKAKDMIGNPKVIEKVKEMPKDEDVSGIFDPKAEPVSVMRAVNKLYSGILDSCC